MGVVAPRTMILRYTPKTSFSLFSLDSLSSIRPSGSFTVRSWAHEAATGRETRKLMLKLLMGAL